MKFFHKMILLIGILALGFCASLGLILTLNSMNTHIRDIEYKSLSLVSNINAVNADLRGLISTELSYSTSALFHRKYQEIQRNAEEITVQIENLAEILPAAGNEELMKEMEQIQLLWRHSRDQFSDMDLYYDELKDIQVNGTLLEYRFTVASQQSLPDWESRELVGFIGSFIQEVNGAAVTVENFNQLIDGFLNKLHARTEKTLRIGRLVSTSLIAAILSFSLVAAFVFSRRLEKRIREMYLVTEKVSERNLTMRANVRSRDELGSLGMHINEVLEIMGAFLNTIRESIARQSEMRNSLSGETEASSIALHGISEKISSMRDHFQTFAGELGNIDSETDRLIVASEEILERIQRQIQAVSVSAEKAALMSESVGRAEVLSGEYKSRAGHILEAVENGGKQISDSAHLVHSVDEDVQSVLDLVGIIENISVQINLLSVNAAIQSARAGEKGRGFGVVAGEIRSLAASTSENVAHIADTLTAVAEKIRNASRVSAESFESFATVKEDIVSFSHAMLSLLDTVKSIAGGAREILDANSCAVHEMKGFGGSLEDMCGTFGQVGGSVSSLRRTSAELGRNISSIESRVNEILSSVDSLDQLAKGSYKHLQELEKLVTSFKT